MRRAAREQWMKSCGCADALTNMASLPSGVDEYDQLPANGVAVLKSGTPVWAWSEEAAISANAAATGNRMIS